MLFLFIPLLIIRKGLGGLWIGYFFFGIAVPLIFLESPFSKLAEKKGFKIFFKIGFLILCFSALICFFLTNIYWIIGVLVLSSVGLAMIEPTTEAYFFDILNKKEELKYYGPYNTTIEVNYFIGSIFSATLLLFLPFEYIFLLFAGFMFILFLISYKTEKIIESKRR